MATNGRLRDYLTKHEVRGLLRAAKQSKRYGARNYAMILLAYRHGLRASELVELRVDDIDFRAETIYCSRRRKGSKSCVHPMKRDEIEAIERILRGTEGESAEYVFRSERGERMTRWGFWRIVSEAGKRAGLPMKVYAHMLRHATGYYLANKGCDLRLIQDYLGHTRSSAICSSRRSATRRWPLSCSIGSGTASSRGRSLSRCSGSPGS
jgi:site-specific recombinase XerD